MIDRYTKCVLTIIAGALVALNVNLFWPSQSQADLPPTTMTVGEFKIAEDRKQAINNLPLVMVLDVMKVLEVKVKSSEE